MCHERVGGKTLWIEGGVASPVKAEREVGAQWDQGPEFRLLPHLCLGLCGFCLGQKPHPRPNPVQNSFVQKLERNQCRKRQFASNNRISIPTVWLKWRADVGFTVPMCCWGWRRRVRGHRGGRDTAFSPNFCHLGWCKLREGVMGRWSARLRNLESALSAENWSMVQRETPKAFTFKGKATPGRGWLIAGFPQPRGTSLAASLPYVLI